MGNAIGWGDALVAVERSIEDCIAALDRYEAAFADVMHDPPAGGAPPDPRVRDWDARLGDAARHADEVERLLTEQEAVWGRWQESLAGWRRHAAAGPPG